MNYTTLLVGFRNYRRKAPIGKNAILLYFILWEYVNEYRLPTEGFTAANSVLQANSGLSRRDLDNARNELKLNGYIDYKKGSGSQSGVYLIVSFDTQSDTQIGTQIGTQSGTQTHHISITKQNKTKRNKNNECVGARSALARSAEPKRPPANSPQPKQSRFAPPSVEDVAAYCLERANGIDPQYFCDFYQARAWCLNNGKKMADWRAAVRTWERRDKISRGGVRDGRHSRGCSIQDEKAAGNSVENSKYCTVL